MARDSQGRKVRVDADGVRIEKLSGVRVRVWLIVAAIALVGLALLLRRPAPISETARERVAQPPAAPPQAPPPPAAPAAAARIPPPAPANDAPASEGDEHPMFGKPNPGEPSGVALFPPMGSDPIKRGLVVPEDFELPPGYVRHYQATDDGERVPAILMFHPDYHPVDEHGDPIALPADRIVPPELAPPGMPIQMLELPEEQGTRDGTP